MDSANPLSLPLLRVKSSVAVVQNEFVLIDRSFRPENVATDATDRSRMLNAPLYPDPEFPNLTGEETSRTFALARFAGLDWLSGDVIIHLGR